MNRLGVGYGEDCQMMRICQKMANGQQKNRVWQGHTVQCNWMPINGNETNESGLARLHCLTQLELAEVETAQ